MGVVSKSSSGDWTTCDPYDCDDIACCGDGRGGTQPQEQADRRCTLPLYAGPWGHGKAQRVYLGRSKVYLEHPDPEDVPGFDALGRPFESRAEGCPGGWSRCAYVASLVRFTRTYTSHGYVSNPLLTAETHPHVLEAIQYLERQEQAALGEQHSTIRRSSQ